MKRYYGIINSVASCEEFINQLCTAVNTETETPLKLLSVYNAANAAAKTIAIGSLYATGAVNTSLDIAGENLVLQTLTKDQFGVDEYSATALLSKNLILIVQPGYDNIDWGEEEEPEHDINKSLANIIIRHIVTTTDGETSSTLTSDTYLRHPNDNQIASAIAYEITSTLSGDALVKFACCVPNTSVNTFKNGKPFLGLNIYVYEAAGGYIQNSSRHALSSYFGAEGNFGGFILHKMKEPSSEWGITVFERKIKTPLFTWVPSGDSLLELNTGGGMVNINSQMNRTIKEDVDEDEKPVIQMVALAPIFCPSTNSVSKYAKWFQQTPHDYSYFDGSGHVQIRAANGDSVFFTDHGICLWDAVEGDTDGTVIPGVRPINYAITERPEIPDAMPYSQNMISYFDSKAGLSSRGWMNFKDEDNDMIFSTSPIITSDGACRFVNRATSPVYGHFDAKFYGDGGTSGSASGESTIIYFVAKMPSRDISVTDGTVREFPLLSIVPERKSAISSSIDYQLYYLSTSQGSNSRYTQYPGSFVSFRRGPESRTSNAKQTSMIYRGYFAGAFYSRANTNRMVLTLARLNTNGELITSTINPTGADDAAFGNDDGTPIVDGNITLGGVYNFNSSGSWEARLNAPRWANQWPNVDWGSSTTYPTDDGSTYFDVKFIAVGNMGTGEGKLGYNANSASIINSCLEYLCERFNCTTVGTPLRAVSDWYNTKAVPDRTWTSAFYRAAPYETYIDVVGTNLGVSNQYIARITVPAGGSITLSNNNGVLTATTTTSCRVGIVSLSYWPEYTYDSDLAWGVGSYAEDMSAGTAVNLLISASTYFVQSGGTAPYVEDL